jgi:hypothetical protein
MRRWVWPPSRPRSKLARLLRSSSATSKSAPSFSRPSIMAGPRSTTWRTTVSSQSPAPAVSVSCTWLSKESSGASTAAMPPWAQLVAESAAAFFVTRETWACSATCNA